jgi:hypothetical protein
MSQQEWAVPSSIENTSSISETEKGDLINN